MSDLTEHFKTCDCHDSWYQCPCAEGGHPLDRDCGCCPLGTGLCGPLPSVAQRRDALLAKFEALADEWGAMALRIARNGHPFAGQMWREHADRITVVIREARS